MNWSFSDSKVFRSCQRQWYFDAIVANANAKKEPVRREAYLLSKLQGLPIWRSQLVDTVISDYVLRNELGYTLGNRLPSLEQTLETAHDLYNRQIAFARKHRLRESGLKVTQHKGEFAAWYAIEYGEEISDIDLLNSWTEIQTALTNFYELNDLLSLFSSSKTYVQRPLSISKENITIRATPDVILFPSGKPPIIIDWKVYIRDSHDHRLQLGSYALALKACDPQKYYFPPNLTSVDATEIDLIEVQLITQKERHYKMIDDDFLDVEEYIDRSVNEMQMAMNGLSRSIYQPEKFSTANSPITCTYCRFRSLCWKEELG